MLHVSQQVIRGRNIFAAVAIGFAAIALSACPSGGGGDSRDFQTVWPAPPEEPRFFYERTLRASVDIIEETASQRFQRMATGGSIGGEGISKPYGLAAYDGKVYVGDSAGRQVHLFDLKNNQYKVIGTTGVGTLAKPLGIDVDGQGRLYVVDATSKRVVVYDADGNFLSAMGGKAVFERPTGIAVAKDGSRIFVVDTGGVSSESHHVIVFNAEGEQINTIGKRGSGPGEFNLPLNARMSPDGTLYVVDGGNFRIQAFDQDGNYKSSIGSVGTRSGQFARPKGIAVDHDGVVYISDAAFGNVQLFTPEGELLMWVGDRIAEPIPGAFMLPSGVAIDPTDGRIYFADQYFRKVEVFRPVRATEGVYGKPVKDQKPKPTS